MIFGMAVTNRPLPHGSAGKSHAVSNACEHSESPEVIQAMTRRNSVGDGEIQRK
jgi:hypothetical protein